MKFLCALFLIALLAVPTSAGAQESGTVAAADAATFREIISAQIAAFARDDGAAAFAFAAPAIRRQFATPERFMAMVRSGFQPVYRPRSVSFETAIRLPEQDGEGAFAQPVRVTGPDGRPMLAMYHMERQSDGSWRIAGVVLRALEERQG